ncbi:MAG: putative transposase [Gammaproteobacteria bacterium]
MPDRLRDPIDQDGNEIDILVQTRKDKKAASRFFRKLLKGQQGQPIKVVTDELRRYSAAKKELKPCVEHSTEQNENNRCELSHQPGRKQERQMIKFKSQGHAQRFLSCYGVVNNLYRLARHLMKAKN